MRYLPILVLAACFIHSPARAETPVTKGVPATLFAPITSASRPPLPAATAFLASEPALSALPTPDPVQTVASVTSFGGLVSKMITAIGRTADAAHDSLESGILQQAVRLDDFFGKADSQKEQRTSYLLRWRSSARLEKGGDLNLGSALRASINLSKISERLNLAVSGENEPEPLAPSLPEDPGNPGFDRTSRNTRVINTELRYQLFRSPSSDLFLGAGVNLVLPLEAFARARYNATYKISDVTLVNLTETVFAKTPYGVGETTEISLERLLAPKTVLRWANSGSVSQEIGALEWGSELSLLRELSPRSAVTVVGGIYGNTSVGDGISNYRITLRYRQNLLRSWFFYELAPEVSWPRSDAGNFPTAYAVTFRMEIAFQGKENKKPDAP